MRVEGGERVDVVAVRAGAAPGPAVDVDDGLEDEGWVGGGGVEEGLPGVVARVDVEREKDETGVDHDGDWVLGSMDLVMEDVEFRNGRRIEGGSIEKYR